jgi:5'-methylthioadenosine phosphorylase
MTNLQEAKLAREAEICYATMALVTDYDCWHESEEAVTVDAVIANLMKNAETARRMITATVRNLPFERTCECASALKYAIITQPDHISHAIRRELEPLVGKYLK